MKQSGVAGRFLFCFFCLLVVQAFWLVPAFADYEIENNNSMFLANEVNATHNTVSGYLYPQGDQDWFRFGVSGPMLLRLELNSTNFTSNSTWNVEILDSSANKLWGKTFDAENATEGSYPVINLSAQGTYFLVITNGDDYDSAQQYLDIALVNADTGNASGIKETAPGVMNEGNDAILETEPNDNMYEADSIVAGVNYSGQLYDASDQEWLKFYLDQPGYVTIDSFTYDVSATAASNATNASGGGGWQFDFRNADGELLYSTSNINVSLGEPFYLPTSGTFYLVLSNSGAGPDTRYANLSISGDAISSNYLPTAIPGDDITVDEGKTVYLDASASFDLDGQIVAVHWEQTGTDQNGTKTVKLKDADNTVAYFKAPGVPVDGKTFTFDLTVTDDQGLTDTVPITVNVEDTYDGDNSSGGCLLAPGAGMDGGWALLGLLLVALGCKMLFRRLLGKRSEI